LSRDAFYWGAPIKGETGRRDEVGLAPAAAERHSGIMDDDVKAKLTAAWQAVVARLIETGYDPADVYATMISVGLSGVEDRANDDPRPSGEVRPRIERPRRPRSRGL
jgi:hypothetical protein